MCSFLLGFQHALWLPLPPSFTETFCVGDACFIQAVSALASCSYMLPFVPSSSPVSFCKLRCASTTLCRKHRVRHPLDVLTCPILPDSHVHELRHRYAFSPSTQCSTCGPACCNHWSSSLPEYLFDDFAFLSTLFSKMQQILDCVVSVGWYSGCCLAQSCDSLNQTFLAKLLQSKSCT